MSLVDKKTFYDIVDEIDSKMYYYSKNKMQKRNTFLVLASGESLKINFPEYSVAHLLGVEPIELKRFRECQGLVFILIWMILIQRLIIHY